MLDLVNAKLEHLSNLSIGEVSTLDLIQISCSVSHKQGSVSKLLLVSVKHSV